MIEPAHGIILRTRPLTETSLIVHWLTRDQGRLATVARGARRSKSPFAGKLDLFYQADFNFSRSHRSELHTLREVVVQEYHVPLREHLDCLRLAAYGTALVEQTTETDTPLPGMFHLFSDWLEQLCTTEARPRLVFAFELKLLTELGLAPGLEKSGLKPAARELASKLLSSNWEEIAQLKPPGSAVKNLNAFLHGFLIYHLGKIPKGRSETVRLSPGQRACPPK